MQTYIFFGNNGLTLSTLFCRLLSNSLSLWNSVSSLWISV